MSQDVIPTITIYGTIYDKNRACFIFTPEQYQYVEYSLIQAYNKRAYYRDYAKKHRGDQRTIASKPALLLYLYEPMHSEPSMYYENVQVSLVSPDKVEVILELRHYLYLRTVLQRRYIERVRCKAKALAKCQDENRIRKTKIEPALLIHIN